MWWCHYLPVTETLLEAPPKRALPKESFYARQLLIHLEVALDVAQTIGKPFLIKRMFCGVCCCFFFSSFHNKSVG